MCVFYQIKKTNHTQINSIRAVVGNASLGADAELIDALPNLEIVSSFSDGLDKIDLAKCREKGIRVTNTPDVLTGDIADLAIGLMLAVLRRICECDRHVRKGLWKMGSFELGLTTKILVVACELTPETRHIVNREAIDALGPEGVLINIGRGPHVDERGMVSALVEGRLAGAGLDVFENEPCVPEELFALDNVVLLPHVGSDTVETCKAMADLVISNLEAHFLNEPLLTPVLYLNQNQNTLIAVVSDFLTPTGNVDRVLQGLLAHVVTRRSAAPQPRQRGGSYTFGGDRGGLGWERRGQAKVGCGDFGVREVENVNFVNGTSEDLPLNESHLLTLEAVSMKSCP
ncbi:hypothetical protein DM860_008931 [Cuscuta australis]|uniref:D-isomer specific 2-hydroxyacid dehydrogenase NAD-binding domain-containing protein n=1 Tax=Cuscuta australis TaxID=267555 RepID=A0A328DBL1_9ASTE|nr:hypothetical protein DM860_008931 [Cuscuta australis]